MRTMGIWFLLAVLVCSSAWAESVNEVQEWGKRIKSAETLGALGADLFGESTNYYDGGTTFSVTDIDIPGNNALPVRLARTRSASALEGVDAADMFGNWEIDLPYVSGIFSQQYGWQNGGSYPDARCDGYPYQPVRLTKQSGRAWQYWRGNSLYIPGHGKHAILIGFAGSQPTDGQPTGLGTSDFTKILCGTQIANPGGQAGFSGEGFIALTTDGTKYYDLG